LTHVEAVVFLEFIPVPEKNLIVSHKFLLLNEDIFVNITSLHAGYAKSTASQSKYFVLIELLQWL